MSRVFKYIHFSLELMKTCPTHFVMFEAVCAGTTGFTETYFSQLLANFES